MRDIRIASILGILFIAIGSTGSAQLKSIDQASPEYPASLSSSDIFWRVPGPPPVFTARDLGLLATDEIDGFSLGCDHPILPTQQNWADLFYSVSRTTLGVGAVATEVRGNGAAGDVFNVTVMGNGTVLGGPLLWRDASTACLTTLPGVQSDVDGISGLLGIWHLNSRVYFTVDKATAKRLGVSPADILCQPMPGPKPAPWFVWATEAQLKLKPGDDLDALALQDLDGKRDASDIIYFSLKKGSPSAAALGTASVILVSPGGNPRVIFAHNKLDLQNTDELNALSVYDPEVRTSVEQIHWNTGGKVRFHLDARVANAGSPYVLAGTLSGPCPGYRLPGMPGSQLTLPITIDQVTFLIFRMQPPGFFGVLDAQGKATAEVDMPPVPIPVDFYLTFAFTCFRSTFTDVSEPVDIRIR